MVLGGVIFAVVGATAQDAGTTNVLDTMSITDFKIFTPTGISPQSKPFTADPALGPVWVISKFVASPEDTSGDGKAVFDLMPDGVPVPAGTSFSTFETAHMAPLDPDQMISITMSGVTKSLTQDDLRDLMSEEDFAAFEESVAASKPLRQLINVNRYAVPGEETFFSVSALTMENIRPISLELVIGQGPIPPDVQQYIDRTNRSWLYRYRYTLLAFFSVLVLAGWGFRRMAA